MRNNLLYTVYCLCGINFTNVADVSYFYLIHFLLYTVLGLAKEIVYLTFWLFFPDPARVVNMPPDIYVAIGLPGFIRCPVDANPPVTLVKWKKDGLPLRIDKVSWFKATPFVPLSYPPPFSFVRFQGNLLSNK